MHQPTLRVLQALELITTTGGGKRLADFSRELGIPKSTLVPILQTLCDHHYLSQDEFGRYGAGTALFSMGTAFSGSFPVLEYVRRQLDTLVQTLGETCYFAVLDGGQVLYLEKVDSPQPLRMLTSVGHRLPAYATGIGKALLSGKSEAQLRSLYPNGLVSLTDHTITNFTVLANQLRQAEETGYAWEVEESTPHVRCFAVPIRKRGQIVAAISVTIPVFRFQESERVRILQTLQATAASMSKTFEQTDAHFAESF